jgi:hypothetical protein
MDGKYSVIFSPLEDFMQQSTPVDLNVPGFLDLPTDRGRSILFTLPKRKHTDSKVLALRKTKKGSNWQWRQNMGYQLYLLDLLPKVRLNNERALVVEILPRQWTHY